MKSSSLMLLTVLSVAAYSAPQIPAPAVVVEETTTAPDIYKRRYVGNIVPINNVYSTAKVSGDLISQGFKDGQYVKAGQLLFEIDPTRYAAAVKSIEAKLAQIRAKLAYAESNLLRNSKTGKYQKRIEEQRPYSPGKHSCLHYEEEILTAEK